MLRISSRDFRKSSKSQGQLLSIMLTVGLCAGLVVMTERADAATSILAFDSWSVTYDSSGAHVTCNYTATSSDDAVVKVECGGPTWSWTPTPNSLSPTPTGGMASANTGTSPSNSLLVTFANSTPTNHYYVTVTATPNYGPGNSSTCAGASSGTGDSLNMDFDVVNNSNCDACAANQPTTP